VVTNRISFVSEVSNEENSSMLASICLSMMANVALYDDLHQLGDLILKQFDLPYLISSGQIV